MANNYSYSVWPTTKLAKRAAAGYVGGNFSTDRTLVVGDVRSSIRCSICDNSLSKPSYVAVDKFPNWPHLSELEAKELTRTKASSDRVSDGWYWGNE